MSRSNKSKIAVTLLSALAFGANETSAVNSGVKDPRIVSASKSSFSGSKDTRLGSRNERIEKGVSVLKRGLLKKVLRGLGITLGAVGAANETVAGVMWAKGNESDSILKGKYSVTNFIRSKVKKNDDQNPNPEGNKDKKSIRENIDEHNPEDDDDKDKKIIRENISKHNFTVISVAISNYLIKNDLKENLFDELVNKVDDALKRFSEIDLKKFEKIVIKDVSAEGTELCNQGVNVAFEKLKKICSDQLGISSASYDGEKLSLFCAKDIGYDLEFASDNKVLASCFVIDEDGDHLVVVPAINVYTGEINE